MHNSPSGNERIIRQKQPSPSTKFEMAAMLTSDHRDPPEDHLVYNLSCRSAIINCSTNVPRIAIWLHAPGRWVLYTGAVVD